MSKKVHKLSWWQVSHEPSVQSNFLVPTKKQHSFDNNRKFHCLNANERFYCLDMFRRAKKIYQRIAMKWLYHSVSLELHWLCYQPFKCSQWSNLLLKDQSYAVRVWAKGTLVVTKKHLVAHFRPWWLMVLSLSLERVPQGRCEKHDQDIERVKCIDIMISEKEGIEFY